MKRFLIPLLLLPAMAGCDTTSESIPASTQSAATTSAELSIQGMTCASCAVSIRTAAKKLDGVAAIEVDAETGSARVTFDPARVDATTIASAITDLGYATRVVSEEGA